MTGRRVVTTEDAPKAIGPYSQAILHGDILYCSGALPLDAISGELETASVAAETSKCLENLAAVCSAASTSLSRALRVTIYTTELADFGAINDAYAGYFDIDPPARVTVGVAALPRGARVEIDALVSAPDA